MNRQPEPSTQEVLAGLIERVTYHNVDNGFSVLRAKARGNRDVVGYAAAIAMATLESTGQFGRPTSARLMHSI